MCVLHSEVKADECELAGAGFENTELEKSCICQCPVRMFLNITSFF